MDDVFGPDSAVHDSQAYRIGQLQAEIFKLQAAFAAATEELAKAEASYRAVIGDFQFALRQRTHGLRQERDAAIARADNEQRLSKGFAYALDRIRCSVLPHIPEDRHCLDALDVVRELIEKSEKLSRLHEQALSALTSATDEAIKQRRRADALAARLAQVDGEHLA